MKPAYERQPTNHLIKFLTQTPALMPNSPNEKDVDIPVDRSSDCQDLSAPQAENPTSSSSKGPIEQPKITEQQAH